MAREAGYVAVVLAATSDDTIPTRVFDIAQGFSWPARFPSRVVRNEFTRRWAGSEEDLALLSAWGEAGGE